MVIDIEYQIYARNWLYQIYSTFCIIKTIQSNPNPNPT